MLKLLMGLLMIAYAQAPLVFIHGIKGAKLADAKGSLHWLTGWQALGLAAPSLEGDDLVPAGILDYVRILPGLVEEPVYGPWLEAAAKLAPFHPFAYDWRRDNGETAEKFEAFLARIGPSHVVAHSMGGLITLVVLNRRPELFRSVTFVGVPFAGGIGFLPDLHVGTATGLNRRILSPEVLAGFPSVYALFPERSDALSTGPMDFFDPEQWKSRRLALFSPSRRAPPGFETRFAAMLEKAKAFRSRLVAGKGPYPRVLVVNGRALPTLATARAVDGGWDFDSTPREPGDGRVLARHSLPPEGIPHEVFSSDYEHSALLNDPAVVEKIRQVLK